MRIVVRMEFVQGKQERGFKGHWHMNYHVSDVVNLETNEFLCSEYIFRNSTVFKGKGFKHGDKIKMDVNVDRDINGNIKLSYPKNVMKVDAFE